MQYKIKQSTKNFKLLSEDELIEDLLKARGVEDVQAFLNVNKNCVHDGMLLKNMEKGLKCLEKHIKNNSKIHCICDCDVDGTSSGSFMYLYLKEINKDLNITFHMNKGKVHGIILEELEDYDFDLLIAPDCGTNDCKACTELAKQGKDIIILDHHLIEKNNSNAIVINNQDGIYPNPTLSGVGVCYKFAKEYDRIHGHNYADKFLDLVALGMIGDASDLRNLETRYYVLEGCKKVKNEFLKELLLKQGVIEK